jgi:hypothetical protein
VADLLRNQLNVEVGLESGGFGEFTVLAGEQVLKRRTSIALPSDEEILEAVRSHLTAGGTQTE